MPSSLGFGEVPCAQCGRRETGLAWGERCPVCREERQRRARRLSARWALVATAGVAVYVWLRVPAEPPIARVYGGIAVLATYIIIRRIVTRVVQDLLP